MTRSLYILRHAETLFNVQHKTQGWCDSPLTIRGITQACIAGRTLADRGITFDAYFSSTSERCCDTLEYALEVGYGIIDAPYVRVKGLKEMNFGAFEAKDQFLERFPHGDFYAAYGGETQDEALERYVRALHEVMASGASCPLVVSHGGVNVLLFQAKVCDPKPGTVPFGNCICYHYEFDDQRQGLDALTWIETIVPDFSLLDAPGLPVQVSWR